MLRKIRIRFLSRSRVEIAFVPTRLGRWLGVELRRGLAFRSRDAPRGQHKGGWFWFWVTTDRHVGDWIEGYIEAAPMPNVEDLPIELLLGEGSDTP